MRILAALLLFGPASTQDDSYWKWAVQLSNIDGEESSLVDTNAIVIADDDQTTAERHCSNGMADKSAEFAETDIDCGGPNCAACSTDKVCVLNKDCIDGECVGKEGYKKCAPKEYLPSQRIRVAANMSTGLTYVLGKYQGSATFTQDFAVSSTTVFVSQMEADGKWQGNVLTIDGAANGNSILAVDDGAIVVGDFKNTIFFGTNIMLQPCTYESSGSVHRAHVKDGSCGEKSRIFVAKFKSDEFNGQPRLQWEWAVEAGSIGGHSSAHGVARANDALFITGAFATGDVSDKNPMKFGSTELYAQSIVYDFAASDVFVAKLNYTTGNWIWAKSAGGNSRDRGSDIICPSHANGGCVVVGHFGGRVDEGDAPWPAKFGSEELVSDGGDDVFVAGVSAEGAWSWVLQGNGTGEDRAFGVAELPYPGSGPFEFAIAGYFGGKPSPPVETGASKPTITFDKTLRNSGSENSGLPFAKDIFVASVITDGFSKEGTRWGWSVAAGGLKDDTAYDIAPGVVSNDGTDSSVVITGQIGNDFRPFAFGTDELKCEGTSDFFVAAARAGPSGEGQWDWAVLGGGAGADSAYSLTQSSATSVVIAGASTSLPVDFKNRDFFVERQIKSPNEGGGGGQASTSASSSSFFVAKVASDIPAPTPAPTYAPTPDMVLNEEKVASVAELTVLIQKQGKYVYREYVMSAGTYIWPVDAAAREQFQNINKEIWIKGETGSAGDTIFDGNQITNFFRVVDGGKLTISNILLRNGRSADGAGAIQVDPKGQLVLRSCLLDDNSATGERSGGALQVAHNGDDVGIAEVISSRFSGNKAAAYGGGAIYSSGRVSIMSSTFEGNNAGTYGGDAFNMCGQTQLLDRTKFVQNRDPNGGVKNPILEKKDVKKTGIQNSFFICKGSKLQFHDTSFKTLGKDGTGVVEEKDCDGSDILGFDEFQRFGACVNSAISQSRSLNLVAALVAVSFTAMAYGI